MVWSGTLPSWGRLQDGYCCIQQPYGCCSGHLTQHAAHVSHLVFMGNKAGRCIRRVLNSDVAAVGSAVKLAGTQTAIAMLSLTFTVFMHGISAVCPIGFAVAGRLMLLKLRPSRASHAAMWVYAAVAVFLNNSLQVSSCFSMRVCIVGTADLPAV